MSRIIVQLDTPVVNGKQVSFFSPIGSADARSILIHDVEYALVDSHGQALAKLDYSWTAGALVSVILDTSTNKAYVQNATSNAYIEDTFLRKTAKPEDIDAADRIHGHKLTDSNITGTLAITKGGTGATTVAGARNKLGLGNTDGAVPIANGGTQATTVAEARANLNFKTGTYQGDGNSAGQNYTKNLGCPNSNLIFIWASSGGNDFYGFLGPNGGFMVDVWRGPLNGQQSEIYYFGPDADHKASYSNGELRIRTSSNYLNANNVTYSYQCL